MKKTVLTIWAAVLLLAPMSTLAAEPVTEVNIKYRPIDWQTYEFAVVTNVPENNALSFEWSVDNRETYTAERLCFFFPRGEHVVSVRVADKFGNAAVDSVRLDVAFWSLKNNRLWWTIYLLAVILIVYYWIIKIVYLFNRRRWSRQARRFLDLLDEHGWVERVVEEHARNHAQLDAKPRNKRS